MPARLPDGVVALSGADRARRYRDTRRSLGLSSRSGPSGKSGKSKSLFRDGEFIAVDGEGFSEGAELSWTVGTNKRVYTGKDHSYALLAASDGSELFSPSGRLGAGECLNFLLDIKVRNPRAILVCFGGSYDVCQMLAYDLHRWQIRELLTEPDATDELDTRKRKTLDLTLGEYDYRLEYRPRKALSVSRWPTGARKYVRHNLPDGGYRWKKSDDAVSVTLWDVWGFFQDSFVGVMKKWIPDDSDYQMIAREKANRKVFDRSEIEIIRKYNRAELRCLVAIMEGVRDAVTALGLTLSRWDGAGAIAAAMLKKHEVKDHKGVSPPAVFEAARHAYSGGHIEMYRMGNHTGDVFHYDKNSAYPDRFRELPSLAAGAWRHGFGAPPDGFTMVKVSYRFRPGMPFYPLFFREENGTILYPMRGTGWHWMPEYEAAREYAHVLGADEFLPLEWWHYETSAPVYPFSWINDYYDERQRRIADAKRRGVVDGPEKIIKLGLNSLYGKTAQQVGARPGDANSATPGEMILPPYFQLEWAGYVTAGTRASMIQAALQKPRAIIAIATDGLFTTEPLDLDCPAEKIIGAWEYEKHAGMTMVMPGVYWLHEHDAKPKHYSRGFHKEQMSDCEFILNAWRQKRDYVAVDIERLIGLGTACASDDFWDMRGMFVKSTRELALNGDNSKRYPVMLYRQRPERGLVDTTPRDHYEDILTPLADTMSAPYEIAWLDLPDPEQATGEMYEEQEIDDAGHFGGGWRMVA